MSAEEDDAVAGEYVLGALDADARAALERRIAREPDFAARVADWEARLAPLNEGFAALPPPKVFAQIESRLFGAPRRTWLSYITSNSLIGTAVMTALSVLLLAFMLQIAPEVREITLTAPAAPTQFLARIEGDTLTIAQTAGPAAAPARSYELWIIRGSDAPLSLGLISASLTLPLPADAIGATFAITDEPLGGAPGGVPTGAIIAAGQFSDI